jgi:hypothetical protein
MRIAARALRMARAGRAVMQSFATSKPRKSGSRQRWGATIVLAIVIGSARPVAGGVNA